MHVIFLWFPYNKYISCHLLGRLTNALWGTSWRWALTEKLLDRLWWTIITTLKWHWTAYWLDLLVADLALRLQSLTSHNPEVYTQTHTYTHTAPDAPLAHFGRITIYVCRASRARLRLEEWCGGSLNAMKITGSLVKGPLWQGFFFVAFTRNCRHTLYCSFQKHTLRF